MLVPGPPEVLALGPCCLKLPRTRTGLLRRQVVAKLVLIFPAQLNRLEWGLMMGVAHHHEHSAGHDLGGVLPLGQQGLGDGVCHDQQISSQGKRSLAESDEGPKAKIPKYSSTTPCTRGAKRKASHDPTQPQRCVANILATNPRLAARLLKVQTARPPG